MQIHKSVNETDEEFRARAFRWNRLVGEVFARRNARYTCDCNQGRLPCTCEPQPFIALGAYPVDRAVLRATGMLPDAPGPLHGVSRVRACWYGAGLVFGGVCIAMAVFGMGQ